MKGFGQGRPSLALLFVDFVAILIWRKGFKAPMSRNSGGNTRPQKQTAKPSPSQ